MSRYPSLYEINTRVWLADLDAATLESVPDWELDRLAECGFDWIWLLGVWQTGEAGRAFSRTIFPNVPADSVCGSCFAITGYEVHTALGGNTALVRLRERLKKRGMSLMLDFVANHTALDHPWASTHREFYIPGADHDGLAYGRDPNFPGWPDTLQLNYANPELQDAMFAELLNIAALCDGVRCDMAMLLLPDVFERTWNRQIEPFWPSAIQNARSEHRGFTFLAEAYWDLEWTLQQQGFDYAYDKRLYDRLRAVSAGPVRDHLGAGLDYQDKLARFLENHDEPRAAATFAPDQHRAAAILTYCAPGLRFFHQGQLQGWTSQTSVHLCRRRPEPANPAIVTFYRKLLEILPQGDWRQLACVQAWDGNPTHFDMIAFSWPGILIIVNYSNHQSQCRIDTGFSGSYTLRDLLSGTSREQSDSLLFVDLPPWGYNVFTANC